MNRYIYHYNVRRVSRSGETILDGIAVLEARITGHDSYKRLKNKILETEPEKEGWSVQSLSFLGMEAES